MLARAMEINTFVTNSNVHANKNCSRLKCKLLGRRWKKWEERKLEVSVPGCTGVTDHNYGWVMSLFLPLSHRPFHVQPRRRPAEWQSSFLGCYVPEDSGGYLWSPCAPALSAWLELPET